MYLSLNALEAHENPEGASEGQLYKIYFLFVMQIGAGS